MIDLLGITIHEPDVVFTDLVLAGLGAWFAWRLATGRRRTFSKAGATLMGGLGSAAFWGAVFHAFFPQETATTAGFIAWIPVSLSIAVAATAMLHIALEILLPGMASVVRRGILAAYVAGFATVVLLVDESFTSIVFFYVPALLLFLAGAGLQAVRTGSGWNSIVVGLLVSVGAALMQQAGVSLDPDHFDHNAVYHVIQSIALVILYRGFRELPEATGRTYATGQNPTLRSG
ncbi:MAG TPA: hypothetical protein VD930_13510 [Gemmatimonadales bacterium]|nr:hypothetical protein [Gemmatimonadales bacterium]